MRSGSAEEVRVALALPSFVDDPEIPIALARSAEDAGLDGVFAFDHLFREGPGGRRSALDCMTLLGAVASETAAIALGPLVARVTLRHPSVLAAALDTLQRVSGGRVIAALGAGDGQNARENAEFGLPFGTRSERVHALSAALSATRGHGFPVWVGGSAAGLRDVVAVADGWNRWGGTAGDFERDVTLLRAAVPDSVTFTWGGLAVLGATDETAAAKAEGLSPSAGTIVGGPGAVAAALRAYVAAGAEWVVVAPVDSSGADNPALLGDVAARLRRGSG